jgi:hypothetical protein
MNTKRLRFECTQADTFRISRREHKKLGRVTEVEFRCLAKTSALAVLDYVLNIGGPQGIITLEPLQGDLFEVVAPAAVKPDDKLKPKPKKIVDGGSTHIQ